MNNMFKLLWSSVLLVMSCAPQSAVVVSGGNPSSGVSQNQAVQVVKATKVEPYTGPITIKIDTGLLNKNNPQRRVVTFTTPVQTFKTQTVPSGPVVFQETFVRTHGQDVTMRTFVVTDPAKFYTVHVQNGDAQGNNETTSAVVNINGFDWIRANEIKKQIPEVQKDSVLLQANNVLTVTHHGSPGSTFTLTVVEGGQAGTIRRRNGPMNDHPTQADHVKGLDKNIFDPTDSSSLGDLQPAEGDTVFEDGFQVSQFFLTEPDRETLPIDFEAGILTVEFQNPTTDLATFQQLYGATVRSMTDIDGAQFYHMQLDLNRSPVLQAESLLRAFNVKFNRAISEISLSSLAAFKTLVLELDMLVNRDAIIKSVSVNGVAQESLVSSVAAIVDTSDDLNIDDTHPGSTPQPNAYGKVWWLNDTRVREAWNYSIGTGAKVAYIDKGYGVKYHSWKE